MMEYQFDFDKMTIRDVLELQSNDMERIIAIVDKLTVGGVFELPGRMLVALMGEFGRQYKAWIEDDAPEGSENTLRNMLRDIKGLE